jgi:hypothetical protein
MSHARRSSLLGGVPADVPTRSAADSISSKTTLKSAIPPSGPSTTAVDPPIERFMSCELGDIRLSEIGELLRDYRRLGQAAIASNVKLQTGATDGQNQ